MHVRNSILSTWNTTHSGTCTNVLCLTDSTICKHTKWETYWLDSEKLIPLTKNLLHYQWEVLPLIIAQFKLMKARRCMECMIRAFVPAVVYFLFEWLWNCGPERCGFLNEIGSKAPFSKKRRRCMECCLIFLSWWMQYRFPLSNDQAVEESSNWIT